MDADSSQQEVDRHEDSFRPGLARDVYLPNGRLGRIEKSPLGWTVVDDDGTSLTVPTNSGEVLRLEIASLLNKLST